MFIVAFPTTVYPNPAPPPPAPFFPSTPALATPFFCSRVFFFFPVLFFFFFFAPNHAACIRSGIRIDTDTDIPPPSSDPIRGWWSLYRPLSPSRASPSLSLSLSVSPSFSRLPSNRERYSTVFRISEMAREGWLTIFYCSNRPTNDPCREI